MHSPAASAPPTPAPPATASVAPGDADGPSGSSPKSAERGEDDRDVARAVTEAAGPQRDEHARGAEHRDRADDADEHEPQPRVGEDREAARDRRALP